MKILTLLTTILMSVSGFAQEGEEISPRRARIAAEYMRQYHTQLVFPGLEWAALSSDERAEVVKREHREIEAERKELENRRFIESILANDGSTTKSSGFRAANLQLVEKYLSDLMTGLERNLKESGELGDTEIKRAIGRIETSLRKIAVNVDAMSASNFPGDNPEKKETAEERISKIAKNFSQALIEGYAVKTGDTKESGRSPDLIAFEARRLLAEAVLISASNNASVLTYKYYTALFYLSGFIAGIIGTVTLNATGLTAMPAIILTAGAFIGYTINLWRTMETVEIGPFLMPSFVRKMAQKRVASRLMNSFWSRFAFDLELDWRIKTGESSMPEAFKRFRAEVSAPQENSSKITAAFRAIQGVSSSSLSPAFRCLMAVSGS